MKTVPFAVLAAILLACGGPPPASTDLTSAVTRIKQTKCSACHAPHEPGFSKAYLERILAKHKAERRANLTDEDWSRMIDYLSSKPPASPEK